MLRASLVTGSGTHCLDALLVQGEEGVVTRGGYSHQGFGENAHCVWGTVVGGKFNKLCCVLHYCAIGVGMFGWDGATATLHPMGKLVGNAKFVTVVGEGAC